MLAAGNTAVNTDGGLAGEREIIFCCHILLNLCLYFPKPTYLFSFALRITQTAFQYVTDFSKMLSQHVFHDIK